MKNKDLQQFLQQFPDEMEVLLPIHDGLDLLDGLTPYTCTVAKLIVDKYHEVEYHWNKDKYWFSGTRKETLNDLGEVSEETVIIIE